MSEMPPGMTRRYRYAAMIVEGDGSKMHTVEIGSKVTIHAAEILVQEHRRAKGISPKRTGIFDRKRKRWHRMPSILA